MRYMAFFLAVLAILSVGMIMGDLLPARQKEVSAYEGLVPEMLPGNPVPSNFCCCTGDFHGEALITCRVNRNSPAEGAIWIAYDVHKNMILYTTVIGPTQTAGDLILAWGVPTGYLHVHQGHFIVWPDRYAYVIDRFFSPSSKISFIQYGGKLPDQTSWQGFTNSTDS